MHWRSESVNAILVLRGAVLSDHWDTTAGLAQEHLRLSATRTTATTVAGPAGPPVAIEPAAHRASSTAVPPPTTRGSATLPSPPIT
ncbi:MAG: hypothetical protein HYX53_17950 [Chloroflexi bacterium]|nr:hypothetical protein [Chloroflexota bacterium]